jgi:prepilin-type N-terminal cleavage/methylation domain-containing protein
MNRGLTLIEMVVTLAILATAAAVVAPALARRATVEETPADAMVALLNDVRRTAMEQSSAATLLLDPATGRYQADLTAVNGARTLATGTVDLGGGTLQARGPRVRVVFRPDGSATEERLTLVTPEHRITVTVDPWTGAVRATR